MIAQLQSNRQNIRLYLSGGVFWWLIWLLSSLSAAAQQPFVTDDADVTEKNKFHLEIINEFDRLPPTSLPIKNQNTARFTLGYGLFERVEISASAPIITLIADAKSDDGSADPTTKSHSYTSGVGDATLTIKYNFLREPENSFVPALTATAALDLPTGDAVRGTGNGAAGFTFNIVAQKTLNEKTVWRLNGGLASAGGTLFLSQPGQDNVVPQRARGRVLIGATSLVRTFTNRLQLGAEIAGAASRNADLGRSLLLMQVGGNYKLNERMTLDFGVLGGRLAAAPRLGAQIGVAIDF